MKAIRRSGWSILGMKDQESISEHSLRVAQIAFILAVMEKHEDPNRVCAMGVFHEIGEIRIGDVDKINLRYLKADEAGAVKDQTSPLDEAGKQIAELWKESDEHETHGGMIAKDADRLELMVTAKEYMENGYPEAVDWFNNPMGKLQTESAKQLGEALKNSSANDWWKGLKVHK